jgi:hypothetical protein
MTPTGSPEVGIGHQEFSSKTIRLHLKWRRSVIPHVLGIARPRNFFSPVIFSFLEGPLSDNINVQNNNHKKSEVATETKPAGETTKPTAKKRKDQTGDAKPKRTPQLHTNAHIRAMLRALQADRPGTTYTDLVEDALQRECDQTACLPPIRLARPDAETLRIQAGIAAGAEESSKKTIRAIIKAKLNPKEQAKLIEELEHDVARFGELRRTMMRQAAIPMVPNLPADVSLGIEVLEGEKLECTDKARKMACETNIQILKAYRPPEYDLPKDLRDPVAGNDPA